MSCYGCRVLRRGCSENCILRACLDGIADPRAQGHATLFVSKFFGRSDLMSFISAVPDDRRSALFKSLLYEACGRTVNPVSGAVGLLSTGNWNACQKAVETVLAGGNLRPLFAGVHTPPPNYSDDDESECIHGGAWKIANQLSDRKIVKPKPPRNSAAKRWRTTSFMSSGTTEVSDDVSPSLDSGEKETKLLNLFV